MHPEIIITLVHGTFAQGAPWTQLTSDFVAELERGLHRSTMFTRVDWSGHNDVYARLEGGKILSKHLGQLKEQYPRALQYVVAHSHGGNVAIYATRDLEVDGIACLATPFFHARQRDGSLLTDKSVIRGLMGAICLICFLFGIGASVSIFAWIAIMFVVGIVCCLVGAVFSSLAKIIQERAEEMAGLITAEVPRGVRLCSIRVTGDEASSGLATGQLLAWASVRLSSHFAKAKDLRFLREPLRQVPLPKIFWILPVLSLGAGAVGDLSGSSNLLSIAGFLISASILILGGLKTRLFDNLLYGASYLFLWFTLVVGAFMTGTFPPDDLEGRIVRWSVAVCTVLALEITTETTPPGGPWDIFHFPRIQSTDELTALAHSAYDHPEARKSLIDWINAV
ncbi:hypothetical protein [Bradyrhizobium sp. USDA 3458]|uniref:hypothetical protein n=1 Tax=Bradyrhizobium sp. USDA 3458 TaxID=2591461 RepID=UPI001141D0B5|nr:hypothetical protein [Bradyrhizobium sp. USDA 3458]